MTTFPIRLLGDDEADRLAFARAVSRHFYEDESDDELRAWLPVLDDSRSFVATDGDRIVGNWGAFQVDISVPGGTLLPCSGVTAVGVSQAHRRRGLLRGLMAAGLDDAVERGQPVAALYASESAIYPRFGFGVTAPSQTYHVDTTRVRLRDPVDTTLVRDLDVDDAVREAAAVYSLLRARRPGAVGRLPAQWHERLVADPPSARGGASSKRLVHVPGRGYALYRVADAVDGELPAGQVRVLEFAAIDPEAEQALWQHLLAVDLTTSLTSRIHPVDDALPWMVDDRMRLRASAGTPLYTRILDVVRCLGSRVSGVTDGLVLEVHDADRDQSGTYRWDVSPEGAACSRTDAAADVAMSIETLAACWLGGTSASQLRAGRRLEERTPGAVERLDRMVAVPQAPWTPWEF